MAMTVDSDGSVKETQVTKVNAPALDASKDPGTLPSEQTKSEPIKPLEKFKSIEEQAKAYPELEKQMGKLAKELGELRKKADPKAAEAKADASELTIQPAEEALAKQGIKLADLEAEYVQNGNVLTDETYAKLEAAGFSRDDVNKHITEKTELVALQADKYANEVLSKSGLKMDEFKGLQKWAAQGLSPAEQELFNEAVNSGNPEKAAVVIKMADIKYRQEVGREGKMIHGEGTARPVQGYESEAQMVADMSDKRYDTDPAYRKMVENKIARNIKFKK